MDSWSSEYAFFFMLALLRRTSFYNWFALSCWHNNPPSSLANVQFFNTFVFPLWSLFNQSLLNIGPISYSILHITKEKRSVPAGFSDVCKMRSRNILQWEVKCIECKKRSTGDYLWKRIRQFVYLFFFYFWRQTMV